MDKVNNGWPQPAAMPYNNSVETGFRLVVLLHEFHPRSLSLRELVILDYLLVHSGDLPDGPTALHPQTPFRRSERFVRRGPIQRGLSLFSSFGFVEAIHDLKGISYRASDYSTGFLRSIRSDYANELLERARWLAGRFLDQDVNAIEALIEEHVGKWAIEFEFLTLDLAGDSNGR